MSHQLTLEQLPTAQLTQQPTAGTNALVAGEERCDKISFVVQLDSALNTSNAIKTINLINHARVKTLRALFKDVILEEVRVFAYQASMNGTFTQLGAVRFGIAPSSTAVVGEVAKLKMLPTFALITMSSVGQNTAAETFMPAGVETNFAVRHQRAGHPEVVFLNDGYAAASSTNLFNGYAQVTFNCTGRGSGVEVEL